jgi:hypothetical protein
MSTPRWVVARSLSLYQMAAFGGMAGGSWLWGSVAENAGLTVALQAASGVLVLCALLGLWLPLENVGDRDLGPRGEWNAPSTAVPVEGRTGPVVIAIDWRIAEMHHAEFLELMSERRRIRRRDGALNWMLLRDLSDPELWVERYQAPTWLDYVRLNNRVTRDDAELFERLRQLSSGPPKIHRMIEREARRPDSDAARAARELATPLTDPTRMP